MSNRLHQLILGVALSGLACGAWAQSPPDGAPGTGPGGPGAPGGPGTSLRGEHSDHPQWAHQEEGRDGDHDGPWDHGGHRHHHHCHHHHRGWGHEGHHGWGHEGGGDEQGWQRHGGMMGMGGPGLMFAARDLNLTDAQRQQMHTILSNARQQAMKDREAMRGHKPGAAPDMAALLNPGDPNYGAAVQAAKKRAADRIQRMSDLKLQLYNVLTAEQKSELSKRIASWKARMAQRADGDAAKGPPGPANR